jgi:osmotically-inducible protein OsmY
MVEDRSGLIKGAGLLGGVLIGAIIGPVLLRPTALYDPGSSAIGAFAGALLGYALATATIMVRQRRRDRELTFAANSVLREAGFPAGVVAEVKNSRALLVGEVDTDSLRRNAAHVLSTVPGIAGVTNRIRVRSVTPLTADEIKRRIEEALLHDAELDARGIKVRVDHSRIVLEGKVHSLAEWSEAEDLAWDIPGIEQVENHLEIAA